MESIVDLFVSAFNLFVDNQIFGMPLIVWFILPMVFTAIFNFVKGKK